MIPISVCIIGKNEEKNIENCLAPLVPCGFEIIYVDTGSTDRTKELAAKYTDHIYDFEWIGDFSAARNFSLQKASHNYVLVLDCDEFLTEIDLPAIEKAINEHPRGVGQLLRINYSDSNRKQTFSPDRVERLFHKRYYHYYLSIHEQVADIKTDSTLYECYEIPLTVDHVGYAGSMEEKRRKAERNNELLFKEIEKHPDNPYFYFQVGQSYNMIQDYENSYLYYKKAFELPLNPDELWVQVMAVAFINAMTHTERSEEALAVFEPIAHLFADTADFHCSMGNIYLNQEPPQPLKAMMEYVKASQAPNHREDGTNTYIAYYNMGVVNEMLNNMDAAIGFYQKAAAYEYPLAVERLAVLKV
ncbi:MAG: glycosyltransferase family 2 protein [Bacteroidales bacterium]|nr:glycosyltransferase family 2 protein [Bacteroidales bacterium]MCM1416505.1 glycosyltransferase family 2 protein [bacterium]MCM1422676.1 glycosyltransferase family 2 protein [bacterium]